MKLVFAIISLLIVSNVSAQDYSKKSYASIHMYAERLMGMKIVDDKNQLNRSKGIVYYYKEKDIAGNFVHVSGLREGDFQMAMWKMDNGNDLIGVTSGSCQPVCLYECSFYEFTALDSTDITSSIFPLKKMSKQLKKMKKKVLSSTLVKDDNAQFKFILPHDKGVVAVFLSINSNSIEFPIMDLIWDGNQFVIQKTYKEIPN